MIDIASALAIDALAGEPPARIHPTTQMGNFITLGKRWHEGATYDHEPQYAAFLRGAMVLGIGIAASATVGSILSRLAGKAPRAIRPLAMGALLKPAFSLKALLDASKAIEKALLQDDLDKARRLLSWHLVSRDTSNLSASEVIAATIESLTENLSDSVIAPLLYYRLAGLPAAYAYRFINTADAMLGYRIPELEWFGKSAARIDDLVNYLPARLTALTLVAATPAVDGFPRRAWRILRKDAGRTKSPNAGWPMAAAAGALNCRLSKQGQYVLNHHGREPSIRHLRRTRTLISVAAGLGVVAIETVL